MSRTMRIDLIPDVPTRGGSRRRLVIKSGGGKRAKKRTTRIATRNIGLDLYRELLDGIYDAALITDMDGVISDVNVRAAEFLLRSRDELIGLSITGIIVGAKPELIQMLAKNLEEERHSLIQAYCRRKDGTTFPSEIAVNKLRIGGGQLCFFVRDITVRRQAEEMLRTEHNAIQNAANGIAIADLAARMEYVNPAFADMLGYADPSSLVGVSVRDILGEGDVTEQMIATVLNEGETWQGELTVEKSSGEKIDLAVFAACNLNSDGNRVGIVFSFTDLSDRNRAEEALRKAEQNRVMLETLGAACHHLGQPATVLSVSIGIIKAQLNSDDKLINDLVDTSSKASEQLGDVLKKLNEVNVYRTTSYLNGSDSDESRSNRILDI